MYINTTVQTKPQDVVNKFKAGMSYPKFTAEINAYLPVEPYQGNYWQHVATALHKPKYYPMHFLTEHAEGWVRLFAVEMIEALLGEK